MVVYKVGGMVVMGLSSGSGSMEWKKRREGGRERF